MRFTIFTILMLTALFSFGQTIPQQTITTADFPVVKQDTVPCFILLSEIPASIPATQSFVINGYLVREIFQSKVSGPTINGLKLLTTDKQDFPANKYIFWNYQAHE